MNGLSIYLPPNGNKAQTSGGAVNLAKWDLTGSPGVKA